MYPAQNSNHLTSKKGTNAGQLRTPNPINKAGWSTKPTIPASKQGEMGGQTQTYATVTSNQTQSTSVRVDSNGSSNESTTRRKIVATVGQRAQGLVVDPGAILAAVAGSRVVTDSVADALAVMDKAIEAEKLDRDRIAEILTDSVDANIKGVTRAIAGYEVILNKQLEERNNLQETGQLGSAGHKR